jgi:hypothetical protein
MDVAGRIGVGREAREIVGFVDNSLRVAVAKRLCRSNGCRMIDAIQVVVDRQGAFSVVCQQGQWNN